MNPTYQPAEIESRWYERWEAAGIFRPEYRPDGEPFCVVIPPPNVTGSLHMGHALNHALHDTIIRRKRMQGFAALWIPGTDHAGIATQNVVERELALEGLTRHDLGREAFVAQVWEWKRRYGDRITSQMRRMGNSCDWTRERFTMDEGMSATVREVFVRLYEEGFIYRGKRIINWCPRCGTALAEIEVEHTEVDGTLTSIVYPFVDGPGGITVATTRPETMLGDTAVAVHPDDVRYRAAVGRSVRLPLVGREIPVVADSAVERDFGSGAVKVTPAHDPDDYEIGLRHRLESIVVIDTEGRITADGGRLAGMDRYEARAAIIAALTEEGSLAGSEPHRHAVGHCYRCGTVIEPRLSLQWFVAVEPLVGSAIEAVRTGATRLVPDRWEKSYLHWMENLRDWTISRQIWWGHRIPAWYCPDGHVTVSRRQPPACGECSSGSIVQEEDVLDTWFSSALWPFSTLGWPERSDDLDRFYPNALLITGFDIISFWVARMMMLGLHFMGEAPFPETLIHGLVRDAEGAKMSKSKGNTIDPLDVVGVHGVDPLRLALIQAANPGQDVPLDLEWVAGAQRFGNKLWNAARFVLRHVEPGSVPPTAGYPQDPGPVDGWILSRFGETANRFDGLADEYRFADAYGALYSFAWSEVFDWYFEMAKIAISEPGSTAVTLGVVMRDLLKFFHPAMPFLTEELWGELVGAGLLAGADWPRIPAYQGSPVMTELQDLISGIRHFRSQQAISPRQRLGISLLDQSRLVEPWAVTLISELARVDLTGIDAAPESGHTRLVAGRIQGFISLEGVVDLAAERSRLAKALAAAEADLARTTAKLANPSFRGKAPADVVAKEEAKRDEFSDLVANLSSQAAGL